MDKALQDEKIPDYTKEFEHLKEVCDAKMVYLDIWRDFGVSRKEGFLEFHVNNVFFTNLEEGIVLDLSKVAKIEDENKQVVYVNENRQNSDLYTSQRSLESYLQKQHLPADRKNANMI